jgi:HNH endonuclease
MTQPFSRAIQMKALARQQYLCASCRERIPIYGEAARASNWFGERAEGHHVIPHAPPLSGPNTVENCVVICRACHLNAHQGGRWSDTTIYEDVKQLSVDERIRKIALEYCHYKGQKTGCDCGLGEER